MGFLKKIVSLLLMVIVLFISNAWAIQQSFIVEQINDPGFEQYPPTPPVHPVTKTFSTSLNNDNKTFTVSTKKQGNISITIENTGHGLIENPYLYGPQGYDYRDLEKLSTKIVEGMSTEELKFLRIHSWSDEFLIRHEGVEFLATDASSTIRRLNQFGGAMCGEMVDVLGGMLYYTPPVGSMYIRKIDLDGHQPAEAWFNGSWHAIDASAELRWVYYDYDNVSYIPSWRYLHNNIDPLISRIREWVGWDIGWAIGSCPCTAHNTITNVQKTGFSYNLRPQESLVMYREMRGRFDHVNRYEELREGRHTVDYGSAVFSYKPDLSTSVFEQYASSLNNAKTTPAGLVPVNSSRLSSVVFPMSSKDWRFVGAQVNVDFKQGGKAYISTTGSSGDWQQLYTHSIADDLIEGKDKFWIKLEFQGAGSGINNLEIAAEIQMNPLIMPWLEYGKNNIHFTADNMNDSSVKVTYEYDDQAKRYTYEPATSNYGRHIWWRIGGALVHNWAEGGHTNKAQYYRRINEDPEGTVPATLEIYSVSGVNSGQKVRTLFKDKPLSWGYYKWYWDGKDDNGNKLPSGMYSYKITQKGADPYGEDSKEGLRLYLFDELWPPASLLNNNSSDSQLVSPDTDDNSGQGNTNKANDVANNIVKPDSDSNTDSNNTTGNNATATVADNTSSVATDDNTTTVSAETESDAISANSANTVDNNVKPDTDNSTDSNNSGNAVTVDTNSGTDSNDISATTTTDTDSNDSDDPGGDNVTTDATSSTADSTHENIIPPVSASSNSISDSTYENTVSVINDINTVSTSSDEDTVNAGGTTETTNTNSNSTGGGGNLSPFIIILLFSLALKRYPSSHRFLSRVLKRKHNRKLTIEGI